MLSLAGHAEGRKKCHAEGAGGCCRSHAEGAARSIYIGQNVNSKKGVFIGILIALILSVSAIFFLSGRPIFVSPEERIPAGDAPAGGAPVKVSLEKDGGLIKSTFYKNIPRLELQFIKGIKEEEVREWLERYEIILLKYDAETSVAEIALTDPSQNIIDVKEQIIAEKNPNLKSITVVE